MIVMHGEGNSLLLHETEGKTVFQTPRRYEVISSSGTLEENGFFAFNNIPVTDEGRPIFEHRFTKRSEMRLMLNPDLLHFACFAHSIQIRISS